MRFALSILTSVLLVAGSGAYSPRNDLDQGRYLRALGEAEARLLKDPGDALALATKAHALASLLRFGEAEALANQALAHKPGLADAFLARGMARAGQAIQQRNLGSLRVASRAMEDMRAATQADPSYQAAWLNLGIAYQQLPGLLGGSNRKALECAKALEQLNPARGFMLRGAIQAYEGRWGSSDPAFQRALALAPGDPQVAAAYLDALAGKAARASLGETAQKSRLAQEARRLLPKLRFSGKGVEAVSEALLEAGHPEEAWAVLKENIETCDAPSLCRLQMGKVAARSGLHRTEGLAALDQVLREALEGASGGYVAAHWRKGQILRDMGQLEKAQKEAEAALRLDSKHRGAQNLLNDLKR